MIGGNASGISSLGVIEPGDKFMVVPGLYRLEKEGNVICFEIPVGPKKGQLASHVVIGRVEQPDGSYRLRTRGPNCESEDPWEIDEKLYRGRVLGKTYDVAQFPPSKPIPKGQSYSNPIRLK